jgi:hypothetical protein
MSKYRILKRFSSNGAELYTVQHKETFLCFWRWTHHIRVRLDDSTFGDYIFTDTTFSSIEEAQAKLESIISCHCRKKDSGKVVYAVTVSSEKTTVTFNLEEKDKSAVYI